MKVILLHLPALRGLEVEDRTESLGLGYIAAVLRRDGHEVEILDALIRGLDVKSTVHEVVSRDFDCLGITAMHEHRRQLIPIARAIRKQKPHAVIAAGGYLPTLSAEHLLGACPEIDFIVRGEGETVASDVFGRIARGENWSDCPGIAFMKDGAAVLNPLPPAVQDLDSLPFPVHDAMIEAGNMSSVLIYSSRGCYHHCSFCSINSFYALSGNHAPRFRSPGNVVDEMEQALAATGVSHFKFCDDDFIGPGEKTRRRAVQIAEEIRARKLKLTFSLECRADEVDEDILKALKEAGLTGVFLGIESGIQRQLDTFDKGITVEQNRRAIEIVRSLDLHMQPGFIPFDPYTTLDELAANMQFTRETQLWGGTDGHLPMKMTLYPGVPLIEKVRADGLLRDNGMEYDYAFKDRSISMVWHALNAWSSTAKFIRGLKKQKRANG